jgi:hypothetical protein
LNQFGSDNDPTGSIARSETTAWLGNERVTPPGLTVRASPQALTEGKPIQHFR